MQYCVLNIYTSVAWCWAVSWKDVWHSAKFAVNSPMVCLKAKSVSESLRSVVLFPPSSTSIEEKTGIVSLAVVGHGRSLITYLIPQWPSRTNLEVKVLGAQWWRRPYRGHYLLRFLVCLLPVFGTQTVLEASLRNKHRMQHDKIIVSGYLMNRLEIWKSWNIWEQR
jgi:hypothetical protein